MELRVGSQVFYCEYTDHELWHAQTYYARRINCELSIDKIVNENTKKKKAISLIPSPAVFAATPMR